MTEMVLVSCSKSKQTGTHRAENLYEPSDIFQKRRRFRKDERVHWGVLSAKHGYLRPWGAIEDYEKHITDRSPVWGAFVLRDLLADLEFYGVDQVTILAGKKYVDPLVVELEAHGYDVVDFNRGLRPGERKRALKKANAPGEQAELITDGGRPQSSGNMIVTDGGTKYGDMLEDHEWKEPEPDAEATNRTSVKKHDIDVIYVTDPNEKHGYGREKYTADVSYDKETGEPRVLRVVEHRWKGNYWRDTTDWDWRDIPEPVRQQVAAVLPVSGPDELDCGARMFDEGGESRWEKIHKPRMEAMRENDDSTLCVECGVDLADPKNAGDPDVDGEWVCDDPVCRGLHETEMTVVREVLRK